MRQGLLNYTTSIPVRRTAAEIGDLLAIAGAKATMAEYQEGEPVALNFIIPTRFGDRAFRLPVDPAPVEKILVQQASRRRIERRYAIPEQAARVAWRIVKSWVEAQLALIQTEMVELEQVMLPYMTTDDGRTFYQRMLDSRLALPSGVEEDPGIR